MSAITDPQLGAALDLARAGFYVFPVDHPGFSICAGVKTAAHDPATCIDRGKHPAVKWDTGASTAEANIRYWWKNASYNIGVHCGKSGLLVVDEDAPGEFARFAANHGVTIPPTYTVTTAKGQHHYFRDTEGGTLGNHEGAFRDYAINVRSGVGYVVGPGSIHETGVVYTADDHGIARLPAWIPEKIRGGKQPANGTPSAADVLNADPFATYQRFVLPDVIKANHRHGTIVQYAGSLLARGVPLDVAKVCVEQAWQRCEQPPDARAYTLELAYADLEDVYNRYPPGRSEGYQKASNGQRSTDDQGQQAGPDSEEEWRRLADLGPHLDGTVEKPRPDIGGERDDGIQLLYPKRWHTVIGLTGCGKTSFALWHIKAVLDAGGHVLYLHFEEPDPGGVLDRLRGIGVTAEVIRRQFHWANCEKKWNWGEMSDLLAEVEQPPALAVLDGINAACSQHGWKVSETEAIGSYRAWFVTPLVKAGAVVLSLGHPPKAKDRQNEMHGFGSTGWLDEVDGVGFRMVASKAAPRMSGAKGFSALYVVKDRYSEVKRWGNLDTSKDQPWFYMGAFIVDDGQLVGPTTLRLNVPEAAGEGQPKSKEVALADHIVQSLQKRTGSFDSQNSVRAMLHEDDVKFTKSDVPVALEILVNQGRLIWPEAGHASHLSRPALKR